MAQANAGGYIGLYFFPPENTDSWRARTYGCVTFYYPLIVIETWLGTVEGTGGEPLWKLSQMEAGDTSGMRVSFPSIRAIHCT